MIKIEYDVFDIAKRLKEIDPNYRVYYNPKNNKYQLYREDKGKVEYQLTFPFDSLDARCVNHCLITRVERAQSLLEKLEKENQEKEAQDIYNARKEAEYKAEELFRKA